MAKLTICMVVLVLAGCASTSEWRALRIDGSSESALRESVTRLDQELPREYHRRMFALALADVAQTGAQNAAQTDEGSEPAYTDEDFRAQLDGLTYDGVIALADQTGAPVSRQYYSGRGAVAAGTRNGGLPGPAPTFNDNGRPASNAWTTGWPSASAPQSGENTVVTRPDSR